MSSLKILRKKGRVKTRAQKWSYKKQLLDMQMEIKESRASRPLEVPLLD